MLGIPYFSDRGYRKPRNIHPPLECSSAKATTAAIGNKKSNYNTNINYQSEYGTTTTGLT